MLTRVPDYYGSFRCLAGACPHSCCTGWEVVLDEATVRRYEETPGPFGERLRGAMARDADGDVCFPLRGGRCPFLNGADLCEIHLRLGEEATSVTCREHPRFIEEYGPVRECTLSASCPAANALLLGSSEPLAFAAEGEAEEPLDGDSAFLLELRDGCVELLEDRSRPLSLRLGDLLLTAAAAEGGQPEKDAGEKDVLPAVFRLLRSLEILEPDWAELLSACERAPIERQDSRLLERIAVYFVFRHLPKAVNDGKLLSRAKFCVLAVLTVKQLASVCGLDEALRRFSRASEHDEENVDAILEALDLLPELSLAAFLQALENSQL